MVDMVDTVRSLVRLRGVPPVAPWNATAARARRNLPRRREHVMDEPRWDRLLHRLGGSLPQSWRWGEFKHRQGWTVVRLGNEGEAGAWMAQMLIKRLGPASIAYVPCGPTMWGDHAALFPEMMVSIDQACRRAGAIMLIMEPDQQFDLPGTANDFGLVTGTVPIQPRSTLVVPVSSDDDLLAAMHHKTRAHVRLGMRQGVVIQPQPVNTATTAAFHALHAETVTRNGLRSLSLDYFTDLLAAFGNHAQLLFALVDGQPAAGVLLGRSGDQATYLFAGSSRTNRGQGAGALLVFRALQWAREHGCRTLDLGNVEPPGLRTFKSGFGGTINQLPSPIERHYRPLLAQGARRVLAAKVA